MRKGFRYIGVVEDGSFRGIVPVQPCNAGCGGGCLLYTYYLIVGFTLRQEGWVLLVRWAPFHWWKFSGDEGNSETLAVSTYGSWGMDAFVGEGNDGRIPTAPTPVFLLCI